MQGNTTVGKTQNNQLVKHGTSAQKKSCSTPHMIRQAIIRMRVNIWAQLVRGNLPINRFTSLNYMSLRYSVNSYIQPIPNMSLLNWLFIGCQCICKLLLFTTKQINNLFEFFFHVDNHFTSVLVFKSTSLIV